MTAFTCKCGTTKHSCAFCKQSFEPVAEPWRKIDPEDEATWPEEGLVVWGKFSHATVELHPHGAVRLYERWATDWWDSDIGARSPEMHWAKRPTHWKPAHIPEPPEVDA